MTEERWKDIAHRFCLQNTLVKAIARKTTSIMVDSHKLQGDDPYSKTNNTLYLCTINTSTASQDGFAVSTAHFKEANLTLAVVLGATKQQIDRVETLLGNAKEAIGHPLLMLGLSAELMLELLAESIDNMRDSCVTLTRSFRDTLCGTSSLDGDYTTKVEDLRYNTLRLDEEVKTFKESLQKALEFFCPNYKDVSDIDTQKAPTDSDKSQHFVKTKIRMRFQDIFSELNSLITLTRISVDEMSSMSSTVTSKFPGSILSMTLTRPVKIVAELTRRDAATGARTARTGTLIAFLAMLYLPTATVAVRMAELPSTCRHELANKNGFVLLYRRFSQCQSSTSKTIGEIGDTSQCPNQPPHHPRIPPLPAFWVRLTSQLSPVISGSTWVFPLA